MTEFSSAMLCIFGAVLGTWVLMKRGVPIIQDLVRDMSSFMLEGALGPGGDLVEGRPGSGSRMWMTHGLMWFCLAASLAFVEMWLSHEPTALHALSAIYWDPSPAQLHAAVEIATVNGALTMTLLGAAMWAVSRQAGVQLHSETNATLTAFMMGGGTFLGVIGAHFEIGSTVGDAMILMSGLAMLAAVGACLINILLTLGDSDEMILPTGWMTVFGLVLWLVANLAPALGCATSLAGVATNGMLLMLAMAVAHHVIPAGAGGPIWSRQMADVTVLGMAVTVTPLGLAGGTVAANVGLLTILGVDATAFGADNGTMAALVMSLAMIPVFAGALNMLATGARAWESANDNPGVVATMAGMALMIPAGVGALFVAVDGMAPGSELAHLVMPMRGLFLWGVLGLVAMGGVMHCFPEAAGREMGDRSKNRWAFWMAAIGASVASVFGIAAAMVKASLIGAEVTDMAAVEELAVVQSLFFYGVPMAGFALTMNALQGGFRGAPLGEAGPMGLTADALSITPGVTTIRHLTAAGAGPDTLIFVESEDDDALIDEIVEEVGEMIEEAVEAIGDAVETVVEIVPDMGELKSMKKAALVDLANSLGLAATGTKADLIERITSMDEEE